MRRMIVVVLTLAAAAMAQAPREEKITKLVKLQVAEPKAIANIVSLYGVQITSNEQMKVMALFGTTTQIAAAEAAIKQLDVVPKTVELTVYFVMGGDNTQSMANAPAVPPDIRDVITQLKSTFQFKEYRMMDVLTLRTRVGSEAETSGLLNTGSPPRMTQFSIRNSTIGEDGAIRIDRMHAGLRIPYQKQAGGGMDYLSTGIDQSVDVKEGQKVVVGRSSLEGPNMALFLVLQARVVQ